MEWLWGGGDGGEVLEKNKGGKNHFFVGLSINIKVTFFLGEKGNKFCFSHSL